MKVNNENAIEVNSELKINVDEQHVGMKHLKEQARAKPEEDATPSTACC